jgi:hypothetical protein
MPDAAVWDFRVTDSRFRAAVGTKRGATMQDDFVDREDERA